MDATDFQMAWEALGDELCRFPLDNLLQSKLSQGAQQFLGSAGLPKDAAPCLSFAPASLDWLSWFKQPDLESYYAVGSDGAGNPFAVDAEGTVWLIEHEAPDHMTFVNSSVPALAESLLAYRDLVRATLAAEGEDAFLDGRIPKSLIEELSNTVGRIDSAAVRSGTFWSTEISVLSTEAGA